MRATSLIVKANSLLSERGSMAISGAAAMWLLKERQHNMRDLMLLSSLFGRLIVRERTCWRPSGQPEISKSRAVMVGRSGREAAKHDARDAARRRRQFSGHRAHGDAGGVARRETIDAGRDRGKRDR